MYKVLLVDDERLELNTLKNYVDWEKLGIGKVLTANNGLQALGVALEEEPDIVFTDIRMPVMDGLEFAAKLREKDRRVRIIFLTGYDEMELIRRAFQLEAMDYILKPFLVEDVEQVVEKVLPLLERERREDVSRRHARGKLIDRIFKDDYDSQEELIRQFFAVEEEREERFWFGVVGLYGREEGLMDKEFWHSFPEIFYYIELRGLTLLLVRSSVDSRYVAENIVRYMEEPPRGRRCRAVYLGGWHPLAEAREIRSRFEAVRDRAFYLNGGNAVSLEELEKEPEKKKPDQETVRRLHELRREIVLRISHADREGCRLCFEEYLRLCSQSGQGQYRSSIMRLYHHINDELVIEDEDLSAQADVLRYEGRTLAGLAEAADRADQIEKGVSEYLEWLTDWYCALQGNGNYRVVHAVEEYIEEHYMEQVSVEKMAEKIGLSPNYVRSIYKNCRGMTINNYLSEFRMDKACRMLRNTTARVSEVARQVGYDNLSYFCASFQKRYGKTPNEWRKGL